jgi:hypothetical protein
MDLTPLPFRSGLKEYQKQAEELLEAWSAGDPGAIQLVRTRLPRFLDDRIPWLPKKLPDSEVRSAALELPDTQLTIARWYDFQSWPALAEYVEAVTQESSPVCRFESAVEAVINGDVAALRSSLRENPELVRSRSTRVTHFDPPEQAAGEQRCVARALPLRISYAALLCRAGEPDRSRSIPARARRGSAWPGGERQPS